MKLADVSRFTPTHWILAGIAAVCALVAVVLVLGGFGFRWDPLNLAERSVARADRRADQAETAAVAARSNAAARSAEAAGAQDTTRLVERAGADRAAAGQIATRYATHIEATAHDPTSVPDDGADLRDAFRELCDLRPSVCAAAAPAAPPRDAGDGPRLVPDPAASR